MAAARRVRDRRRWYQHGQGAPPCHQCNRNNDARL